MVLKRTIDKTKIFFEKTLQNLKSYAFGGYQKLSRAPSMRLFFARTNNPKLQQLDDFYRDFCHQWDSDPNHPTTPIKSKSHTIPMKEDNNASDSSEQRVSEKKKKKDEKRSAAAAEHKKGSVDNNRLAKKMRELEMMDVHDVDHVLDVEEVHYYSRLTSPIYQDLVDKFFMDMYSDFSVPQPSAKPTRINSSMRRLGPIKI